MKDRAKSGGRRAAAGLYAGLAVMGLAITPAWAAQVQPAASGPAGDAVTGTERLFGDYLSGHHAQHTRDFAAAVRFYGKALAADPNAPELIKHTFLMDISEGNFHDAAALADR